MSITSDMQDIRKLAELIQRNHAERMKNAPQDESQDELELYDEYSNRPLRRNKVYTETELEKFLDDRERAASVRDN